MIALEQQKIGRSDAALAGAAEAESYINSLMPGYRTEDITPKVISDYEKQLDQWQEKHGQQLYSVPAMRDLTRIQGKFQADQRVKNIQLDREQNAFYDRFRASPLYDPDTDPNLDPEGRVRQLGAEEYRQYENPVLFANIQDEIDEQLKSIEPRSEQFSRIKELTHEKYGTMPVIEQGRRNVLDESDFNAVREDVVASIMRADTKGGKYIKAKLGEDFTEENVREMVRERERLRYIDQPMTSVSQISGLNRASDDDSIFTGQQFPGAAEEIIDKERLPNLEVDKVNIVDKARLFDISKTMDFSGNREVYNKIKDDPAALLDNDVTRKNFIRNRALDDYYGTEEMFNTYFQGELEKYGLNIVGKSDQYIKNYINNIKDKDQKREASKLNKKRKDVDGWLEQVDEKFNIEGSAFDSDNDLMEAVHIFEVTKNDPDYEWDGFENIDLIEDHEDLGKKQKNQLLKNVRNWMGSELGKVTYPRIIPFSAKSSDPNSVQNITGQMIGIQMNTNGEVVADASPNSIYMGSAVIRPGNKPEDQLTPKEKRKILPEGSVASVTGMVNPETTGLGPGWLSLTIGDQQYYMRGSDEFVESQRLGWNLYSYEVPKNANVGEMFAVRGTDKRTGLPVVIDRWNKDKMGRDENDVWMNTVYNPYTGKVTLKVYNQDPFVSDKRGVRFVGSDENPEGFDFIEVPSSMLGASPDQATFMEAVRQAFVQENSR